MAVFGYCNRVPVEKGTPAQDTKFYRNQIKGYAMLRGLELEKCFVEVPAHALKPFLKRRRAKNMLEGVQNGDVIITPGVEQVFCSATDAVSSIEHLQDAGVSLHIAAWGDDVLMDPRCKDVWPLIQFLARAESRIARQRAGVSKPGPRPGQRRGRIPFGYAFENGTLGKNNKQQKAIRFMESLKADGLGYAAIASRVKARLGFSFSHMGIKNILERERKADKPGSRAGTENGR